MGLIQGIIAIIHCRRHGIIGIGIDVGLISEIFDCHVVKRSARNRSLGVLSKTVVYQLTFVPTQLNTRGRNTIFYAYGSKTVIGIDLTVCKLCRNHVLAHGLTCARVYKSYVLISHSAVSYFDKRVLYLPVENYLLLSPFNDELPLFDGKRFARIALIIIYKSDICICRADVDVVFANYLIIDVLYILRILGRHPRYVFLSVVRIFCRIQLGVADKPSFDCRA